METSVSLSWWASVCQTDDRVYDVMNLPHPIRSVNRKPVIEGHLCRGAMNQTALTTLTGNHICYLRQRPHTPTRAHTKTHTHSSYTHTHTLCVQDRKSVV